MPTAHNAEQEAALANLAEKFGQQVRQRRKARGLTQAQLAEATSMSEEWIRRIERGAGSPSLEAIDSLAAALGTTPSDLFETMADADERMARIAALFASLTESEQHWLENLLRAAATRPNN